MVITNLFLERYKELGEEFDPEKIKVRGALRVNTLKISHDALIERINANLEKIPFLHDGYYHESIFAVGAMPEYLLGYYYLQEAASELCAEILSPKPGETVLDMCAAPGSKTTHIGQLMKNKGVIVALDANNARLPSLKNNLERCGVTNALIYKKDAVYAEDLKMMFDRILLDAPCSGNFATDPEWFEKRKLEDLKGIARTQRKLLETAYHLLNKGGILVYSTCSLEPEENEENVDYILGKYPGLRLEKIDRDVGDCGLTSFFGRTVSPELAKCKRFWPHKSGTQGFFIAKFKKIE